MNNCHNKYIDILVEEQSAAIILEKLIPKILKQEKIPRIKCEVRVITSIKPLTRRTAQDRLLARLLGYAGRIRGGEKIGVLLLIDEDRHQNGCEALKTELEQIVQHAGLNTKSRVGNDGSFQAVTRLIIEELEAWYFANPQALRAEYPRIAGYLTKGQYRNPDTININRQKGTWEELDGLLAKAEYYRYNSMPKLEMAERLAPHMDPSCTASKSFSAFRCGLLALAGGL